VSSGSPTCERAENAIFQGLHIEKTVVFAENSNRKARNRGAGEAGPRKGRRESVPFKLLTAVCYKNETQKQKTHLSDQKEGEARN